jgi:hypothetical protein
MPGPSDAHRFGGDDMVQAQGVFAALEAANKGNEVTAWLSWFAGIVIEAQKRTTARVEFLIEKTRLLDRLGGVSADNYATITGASAATATRDLADMVDKDALLRVGERRYARYDIAIPLRRVSTVVLDEHGNFS